ncbi:MAG: hypothetical protein Q8935_06565 [Bacillota bacterium]|jgi:hypothetical protein|nr:hypothetical protein [Bacillota bacterium]
MKKQLLTAFISILMIFVIAGCSNSGNSNQTAQNGKSGGFQKPDVYGEVSAINGNQITLKLMNIPQMNSPKNQVRGSGTGNMGTTGTTPGNVNGGQGRGGMRQPSYTGQEKTITIPDGVQMTTMTRGTNGMQQNNVTLDQITSGSTLSVYYDTDGKTIKSIRVQKPWSGNVQSGNAAS